MEEGFRFRVPGFGFRVSGFEFQVLSSGFRQGCMVYGFIADGVWVMVEGVWCRFSGFWRRSSGAPSQRPTTLAHSPEYS